MDIVVVQSRSYGIVRSRDPCYTADTDATIGPVAPTEGSLSDEQNVASRLQNYHLPHPNFR